LATLLGTSGGVRELEGEVGPHRGENSRVACVVNRFGRINFLAEPAAARSAPAQAEALAGRLKTLFGGSVEEKSDLARQASPLTYLTPDDPPVLTIHGTGDNTVPIAQAEELDAALKRAGLPHFFVRVVGAGHGFDSPEDRVRSRIFFDRYLRGIEAEISNEPIVRAAKKKKAQ
jgi:acetyl esterase/lipase